MRKHLIGILLGLCGISGSARGYQGAGADELPGTVARDAARIYNSSATRRFTGTARLERDSTVGGDVVVLDGTLRIAGQVRGNVVAINSVIVLEPTARVDREIVVVGGRIEGRELGRVRGDIRTYAPALAYTIQGDSLVVDARYSDEGQWWSRLGGGVGRSRSKITLRGETYNRVEGLPVLIGPIYRNNGPAVSVSVDALGIVRTADRVRWDGDNIGHQLEVSVRQSSDIGIGVGAALYDVVDPIEPWQVTDNEAGLATFFLHRDMRDHYSRHGGRLEASLFRGFDAELKLSFAHERWRSREARDTWTLFRDSEPWRANPEVSDGRIHVATAAFTIDTRNSVSNPWSGVWLTGALERGEGELNTPENRGLVAPTAYSRLMLDLRSYNRISPRGQLNLRLVYGARLGDDPLPLQKRFSLGGPGSLPGFDFRRLHGGTDVGMCSEGPLQLARPALCERMALAQVEYRGDLRVNLFGSRGDDGDWREFGHLSRAQWVVFADAGRGWLIGEPSGDLTYSSRRALPPLGSFRTDIGLGLDTGAIGVYAAKAVSQSGVATNFFVRVRHRF